MGQLALLLGAPQRASAEGTTIRETIADMASNIPGYGPSDVFYPSWFLGDWEAASELVAVDAPQGQTLAGEAAITARSIAGTSAGVQRYPQRFITYRGHIIADRAYNMRGMMRNDSGQKSIESLTWEPSNPNFLSVVYERNGIPIRTDLRVTRRAVGVPTGRDADLFNISEFYQEVVGPSSTGPLPTGRSVVAPKVTPVRCVTKFRLVGGPQIQAIQRLEVFADFGSEFGVRDFGQAIQGTAGADPEKPVAIYRYRAILLPTPKSTAEAGGASQALSDARTAGA